jgi:hypothetical protein
MKKRKKKKLNFLLGFTSWKLLKMTKKIKKSHFVFILITQQQTKPEMKHKQFRPSLSKNIRTLGITFTSQAFIFQTKNKVLIKRPTKCYFCSCSLKRKVN